MNVLYWAGIEWKDREGQQNIWYGVWSYWFGWVSSGRPDGWSWKSSVTVLVKENLLICAMDVRVWSVILSYLVFTLQHQCLFSFPGVWNWQCQAKLPKNSKTTKWNVSPPNICRLTRCCFLQASFTNAHKDRYLILHLYSVIGYLSFTIYEAAVICLTLKWWWEK